MKRKIMLGVSAGLIGALAIAGAAFAQEGPSDGNPGDSVRDRVAEILGIDRETLDEATKTARDEFRDAKQDEKLAALVEEGVITPAQADEIDEWKDARPEALDGLRLIGKGHGRGSMPPVDGNAIDARLTALVEQEVITQAEADEILAWHEAKPDYLDDLRTQLRGERDGQRGERHGRRGPGNHPGQRGNGGPHGSGQFGPSDSQTPPSSETGTTFVFPDGSEVNF